MNETPVTMDELWSQPTVYRSDLMAGTVAIVSGGGSGIGRATALLLARLGAKVAICGRQQEKLDLVTAFAASKGATMLGLSTDIRHPEQIAALFDATVKALGEPDVVVNNAGGQFAQPAIDFSLNGFKAVIENNLTGTWLMMQTAARRWRDTQRPGSIVNVVTVVERGMPGVAHTCAARAGVIGLSQTVAVEWAPLKVRINCVAPGVIATEGMAVYPEAARKAFPRSNPMLHAGESRDIAESIVYLAAPSAKFITGETLIVDGGGRLWGELWTHGKPDYFA